MTKISRGLTVFISGVGLGCIAWGGTIQVSSPGALGPYTNVSWNEASTAISLEATPVCNNCVNESNAIFTPFLNLAVANGITATVTSGQPTLPLWRGVAANTDTFGEGLPDEVGNGFVLGDQLLHVPGSLLSVPAGTPAATQPLNQPITFSFSSPIFGFGTYFSGATFGGYTLELKAFDSMGGMLADFTAVDNLSVNNVGAADGSAAFEGVLSSSANIAQIQISGGGGSDSEFYLGSPDVNTTNTQSAAPEPGSAGFVLAAAAAWGAFAVRRKRDETPA